VVGEDATIRFTRTQLQTMYQLFAQVLEYRSLTRRLRQPLIELQRLVMAAGLYADPTLFDLPRPDDHPGGTERLGRFIAGEPGEATEPSVQLYDDGLE
jgi:hypothetical protein